MTALEGMMMDVRRELQAVRNDLHNVFRAANMASEESQRVALRMDNLEFEWLVWIDNQHQEVHPRRSNSLQTFATPHVGQSRMSTLILWDWGQTPCNGGVTPPRRKRGTT